jgi:predicted DsbA family dithiol-disulfide isomerase
VSSRVLNIDVVSDFVCPWCFVGKRNLVSALRLFGERNPGVTTATRWLPFFLNPDTPPEGEPYRPFLEKKFGGKAEVDTLQETLRQRGRESGIHFAFEKIELRPNTLDAHRLIYRAQHPASGVDASLLSERLFSAHFCEGKDIGATEVLVRLAVNAGDREDAARRFIESSEGTREVLDMAGQIQQLGIGGVPFFIFNRAVAMSGAQRDAVLVEAMEKALAESAPAGA